MTWRWKLAQAAELQWWKNYLRKKEPQAYIDWKDAYWRTFLDRLELQVAPGLRVLDAGCGPAGIFRVLQEQQVVAVDPLVEAYEAELAIFSKKEHVHCRFVALPFEDFQENHPFDWVFCINAINHVADLTGSLNRLVDLMKPEGRLVLSIDVHRTAFFKYLLRLLPTDVLHPHQHSLADYEKLVRQAGGTVERAVCYKKGAMFDYYVLLIQKTNAT
ncbi:MAG: methyltransferase domain-containing protein [Phaeodactylibacter sp.]|nr:methyltransferase domain-containing protein [Phaeodactylibacter sp.]